MNPLSWYSSAINLMNGAVENVTDYMNNVPVIDVIVLGRSRCGKTELVRRLCGLPSEKEYIPTVSVTSKKYSFLSSNIKYTEIGGGDMISRELRSSYPTASALIYVIDAMDREHLSDLNDTNSVAYDLQQLMTIHQYKGVPILFCLNKAESTHAMSAEEIEEKLNLSELCKKYKIIAFDVLQQEDFQQGIQFLYDNVVGEKGVDLVSYSVPTIATSDRPIAVRVPADEHMEQSVVLVSAHSEAELNIQHAV